MAPRGGESARTPELQRNPELPLKSTEAFLQTVRRHATDRYPSTSGRNRPQIRITMTPTLLFFFSLLFTFVYRPSPNTLNNFYAPEAIHNARPKCRGRNWRVTAPPSDKVRFTRPGASIRNSRASSLLVWARARQPVLRIPTPDERKYAQCLLPSNFSSFLCSFSRASLCASPRAAA